MVAGWMSDEESAEEVDGQSTKMIKVIRPSFRSDEVKYLVINKRIIIKT